MKRTFALAAFALLLSACTGSGNTIRIGYLGPLTGDAASYGADTLNAVRMHVDEINAAGGINGKKIELIAEDGRCTGSDSASAVQKLVNVDKVVGIIGGQCSSETLAAAPIVEQGKVSIISPISSNPDITNAGEYVFRVYPSDKFKGKVIAKLMDDANLAKVAILTENTDYCQGIRSSVKENLPAGALVFDEQVDPGTKDYRSLLTRLKDMEFDVLLINGQSDATNGEMMKQARELGITQPFYGTDTADSATLYTNAPEASEGMIFINTSSKLGDSGEGSFGAKFRAKYGEPKANMSFATLAYDALGMLADVLKAEAVDTTEIRDGLASHAGYAGAAGTLKFDKNGDIVGVGYAVKQFKDGEIVELELVPAE